MSEPMDAETVRAMLAQSAAGQVLSHDLARLGIDPDRMAALVRDRYVIAFCAWEGATMYAVTDRAREWIRCPKCAAAGLPPHDGGDLPAALGPRPCGWPDSWFDRMSVGGAA